MDTSPEDLRRRRVELRKGKAPFAREAGVHRSVLESVEAGRARPESVAKIVRTLERLEQMESITPAKPDGDTIEIEVTGNFGVRVMARGSVDHTDRLKESVADVVNTMNSCLHPDQNGEPAQPQRA